MSRTPDPGPRTPGDHFSRVAVNGRGPIVMLPSVDDVTDVPEIASPATLNSYVVVTGTRWMSPFRFRY